MILDLRYHIFTIAAIFAALGLGILIGSSLISNETMVNEQKKLITNINQEMKELREENNVLQAKTEKYKQEISSRRKIEKELLALGFKDMLADKEYIILSDFFEVESSIMTKSTAREIFNITGAKLKVISELNPKDILSKSKIIISSDKATLNNKYDPYLKQISKKRFIKIKSDDIVKILMGLIEREIDERKKSINNNTGV